MGFGLCEEAGRPQGCPWLCQDAQGDRLARSRHRGLDRPLPGHPDNGEISAELGRLALEAGRLDIAKAILKTAEAKGVRDWKTLSAQGTLHAKQGDHAQAQQYFLVALQEKPKKSEQLLRKAVASANEDKRVRQNLVLVLGLQGTS
jgi:Flp pilus assembly protein TadD